MSLLNKLMKVATGAVNQTPTKSIREMDVNIAHEVEKLQEFRTRFGRSVLATLRRSDEVFSVWLPKKFAEEITSRDIEEYKGMKKRL